MVLEISKSLNPEIGAGKTTFVELLAGKNKVGHMTGSVNFFRMDGAVVSRPRIGFVDQVRLSSSLISYSYHFSSLTKLNLTQLNEPRTHLNSRPTYSPPN